jgi:transposase
VTRYVGVDVHKSYLHVGEWVPETGERRHFRVCNRPEGWVELLQRLDGSCRVVLEATGNALRF